MLDALCSEKTFFQDRVREEGWAVSTMPANRSETGANNFFGGGRSKEKMKNGGKTAEQFALPTFQKVEKFRSICMFLPLQRYNMANFASFLHSL